MDKKGQLGGCVEGETQKLDICASSAFDILYIYAYNLSFIRVMRHMYCSDVHVIQTQYIV